MVTALLLTVGVQRAEAQGEAGSLEQLRSLVKVGDKVTVTDVAGREVEGTIAEVSSSSLVLVVDRTRTDFIESALGTVSKRDSRWNGTLWGLVVGAALGASLERAFVGEYGRDDVGYGSVAVPFAALGSAVGFSIDALMKGQRIIYMRSAASSKTAKVSPVLDTRRKGIFVSLQF